MYRTASRTLAAQCVNGKDMTQHLPSLRNQNNTASTNIDERRNCRGPHRLVVRTSRCGRDNPGSTPGVDILEQNKYGIEVIPFAIDPTTQDADKDKEEVNTVWISQ